MQTSARVLVRHGTPYTQPQTGVQTMPDFQPSLMAETVTLQIADACALQHIFHAQPHGAAFRIPQQKMNRQYDASLPPSPAAFWPGLCGSTASLIRLQRSSAMTAILFNVHLAGERRRTSANTMHAYVAVHAVSAIIWLLHSYVSRPAIHSAPA